MEIFRVYSNSEGYKGELNSLTQLIHYVAATPPNENLTITDLFDTLVLTTFGNLLNNVPDKRLLKKIHSPLIELQTGEKPIQIIDLK